MLVVAVDAFQLDARADETVADLAAGRPADGRADALAEDGGVEQPVGAAFDTDIEARLRRLRLGDDRQRNQRGGCE